MEHEPASRIADAVGEVAGRVREVIGQAGCTQREFARRIVMDPSKLSRSLSGSRRFTVAELARIADAGQVDAGWLLGSGVAADASSVRVARTSRSSAPTPAPATAAAPTPAPAIAAAAAAAAAAATTATTAAAPAGGRPLQIVRETVRLIARHGFHAVRVSDIAEACATSTAAIHYHFPGRAELLEAAVRWCMDEDTARRSARIAEAGNAADEMHQLIELQTPATERQREQWLVWLDLWAEAARSTAIGRLHVDYYRQWRTTVADVIRRGIAQGVFRQVDPEVSALRLTALIDGLAAQVLATTPAGVSAGARSGRETSGGTRATAGSEAEGAAEADSGPGSDGDTGTDGRPDADGCPATDGDTGAGGSDVHRGEARGPEENGPGGGPARPTGPPGNAAQNGYPGHTGGTSAEDMRTALFGYIDTELSAVSHSSSTATATP